MSAILVVYHRNQSPVARETIDTMLAARPERGPDGQAAALLGHVGMGRQQFCITPEERDEVAPLRSEDCTLSCDARLDNRLELIRELVPGSVERDDLSDAALILRSYLKWGSDCLGHLLGDFAFVLWDERQQQLFIARDALGANDLCYRIEGNLCLAASEISQILAHPTIHPQLNENRIAAFLSNRWDRVDESFYKNIHYLPPAHGMVVSSDSVKMWRYWDVDPQARIRYPDEADYSQHYRELLAEAVRCRLRCDAPVGISLSGGLDSTSLAALAAPMLSQKSRGRHRLLSFSYAFDELNSCDERRYIQQVVDRYQLTAKYLCCDDKWPLKNLQNWPVSRDFVLSDPYAWLPNTVMNAAESAGVRVLLAGYYGDVLPSGGVYWALGMLQQLRIVQLAKTVLHHHADIDWRRDLFKRGLLQLLPHSLAQLYRHLRPGAVAEAAPGIHAELLARTDLKERLIPFQGLEGLTSPGQKQRYSSLMQSVYSQGISATRYQYNRHGMEILQPYFDRRLVEYVMAVPPQQLGLPGWDRKIHRDTMKGLLPEEVRSRRRQTIFLPLLMKGLQEKERETVKRILADPQVVARNFVRQDWLQQQLQRDFDVSPASMMLWNTISLELWLQRYWS